ncbi:hypothetical protein NQ317_002885 [Molorchus minor]|uniref:CDAN1-interacting nuclease 1 n=1 Tax=Molorchus minor TaxID=1323400 RepID=A0ABQ9JSU7_9CUCU|nr:hypothetical protein NQ317_002885 [Molorchus minor]
MEIHEYNKIISFVRNDRGLTQACMKQLVIKFPQYSCDTLYSILSLEYQKRMKCNYTKTQANKNKYWVLYQKAVQEGDSPGIIIRIAEHFDVAPCLIAKLILTRHFDTSEELETKEQGANVNIYLRNTSLLSDMDLAYEVFLCTLYDNIYSPLTEVMKASLGQQYEVKLHKEVVKHGLAFRDEEHLRRCGYDKTPDCKLEVPVAVDGFIINWIESKALFGDEDAHKEYMKNQYLSYWNRFGPGLVIYWFGYLQTIIEPNDKRFIVRDGFPENIIHMPSDIFNISNKNQAK